MGIVTRVARNTILLSASSLVGALASFLLAILVARYLGASEFGDYSFVFAFIAIFDIFFDVGISVLAIREVARKRDEMAQFFRGALAAKLVATGLSFIALLGILLLAKYPPELTLAMLAIGIAYVLLSFARFFLAFFKAVELMQYDAYLNAFERVGILAIVWFLTTLHAGLLAIMSAFLFVAIAKLLVSGLLLVKHFGKFGWPPDFKLSPKILRLALPFGLTTMFTVAYFNVDLLLLAWMKTSEDVGFYNVAYRFVYAVAFIPSMFMVALFPVLSRLHDSSTDTLKFVFEKALKYVFVLALPTAVGGMILAPRIIRFFYGEEYMPAAPALQVLAWAGGVIFISVLSSTILSAMNKQKLNAALALANLVINVALDVMLIPIYGISGAAAATVAVEAFGATGATWIVWRALKPKFSPLLIIKVIAASIAMAAALLAMGNSLLLLPTFAAGAAVYFAGILLLGYFSNDDAKMAQAIFNASIAKIQSLKNKYRPQ